MSVADQIIDSPTNGFKQGSRPVQDESDDEDVPLSKRSRGKTTSYAEQSDSDEEDIPLSKVAKKSTKPTPTSSATNGKKRTAPVKTEGTVKRVKKENDSKAKTKTKAPTSTKAVTKTNSKAVAVTKSNGTKATTAGNGVKKEPKDQKQQSVEAEEEEDIYRWWEVEENDGSIKWTTLEHNGVLFPPKYEPLPSNVYLRYEGEPVHLPAAAEEVAGFFGAMLESDHAKNPVFQNNFFTDFLQVLEEAGGAKHKHKNHPIKLKEFDKCDFKVIFDHYEKKRLEKRALSSAEKKKIKSERDAAEELYKTCLLDGRKELVGNFRIEPPGLFRGRGAHPKTGKLKARVLPEQVTLNIGEGVKVPEPPEGHSWGEVRHDNTVSWLATWKENINSNTKYVFLAQNSSLKGMSDFKKFEKSRKLKDHVDDIRKDYRRELKDSLMANRQRATAMYLIDVLALRAGGEKGEDEADTVGCCSLRYEHITLQPPNIVIFDFLGKDSIRYHQEVEVDLQVFKNLKIFKKPPKTVGDDIFDRLDPPTLNKHLQNYMEGLTAKVFRTYNATYTMEKQLDLIPNKGTVNEKIVAYNAANRAVAILCNHQRTVSKGHEASVGKIEEKILELRWNLINAKKMILQLEPKLLKKDPEYFAEINSITKDTVVQIHSRIMERETDRIKKKFARDNEKLIADGEKPMLASELKTRLETIKDLEKEFKREVKTGKPEVKANATVEKLKAQIEKYEHRIMNMSLQLKDKEDNSQVALGTSKMNYIDPRLTVMFSKKYDVPLEKLFTKTLREKFNWAIESADENWRF